MYLYYFLWPQTPTQTLTVEFSPLSPITMPKRSCEFASSLRNICGNESRSISSAGSCRELHAVTHCLYVASHLARISRHTWHVYRVTPGMYIASHLACISLHTLLVYGAHVTCIWRHGVTPDMYIPSHLACISRHTWHVHRVIPGMYMAVYLHTRV